MACVQCPQGISKCICHLVWSWSTSNLRDSEISSATLLLETVKPFKKTQWLPRNNKTLLIVLPAHKISDNVSMANKKCEWIFLLARTGPVEVLPETCFYPGTVLIKLLKCDGNNSNLIACTRNKSLILILSTVAQVQKISHQSLSNNIYILNKCQLTCTSGFHLPIGGSGGIGAPSLIRSQWLMGSLLSWLIISEIIEPVSCALDMVLLTISV